MNCINFSEYFSDLFDYSDEVMSKMPNRSLTFTYDYFGKTNYDEIYDESSEENDVIPAIPDPTMAVFFAKKVSGSGIIDKTAPESKKVENERMTTMIEEVLETAGKHKCTCGKGPIPNITMTRLEADKNRHNLILTAQRQRLRSKRETSSEQGQDYDDYIVNGYKDTREPWLAVFFHGNSPFCGGTIINQRFILTGWCK